MAPKVPAKDKESLSLVYTPGVAEACNLIKDNVEEAYNLTNKANSTLLITDGSAFPSGDSKNYQFLPDLETRAFFYKQVFNIDAYPLLLDRDLTKTSEDLFEVLDNLTPGFAGFELFFVEKTREEKLLALLKDKPINVSLIASSARSVVEEAVGATLQKDDVLMNVIIGSILRAALDTRSYVPITDDNIRKAVQALLSHKDLLSKNNYYEIAAQALFETSTVLSAHGKGKGFTPNESRDRLESFFIEGPHSWLKYTEFDYLNESHGFKSNAVELHKVHTGVTALDTKLKLADLSYFKHLFDKKNLQEVREFILKDPKKHAYQVTMKNNMCAIITNGTAVLGLGHIGPEAAMPVMEGKSVLFQQLAGVDVIPFAIKELNADKVISIIEKFGHTFAAINLEDIKAPSCFAIENGLQAKLDIPVFHDDQHGTAIVTLAAFISAIKLAKKKIEEVKLIINGGGAAGLAITELLLEAGMKNIIICDTKGAIYEGRPENMNAEKNKLAKMTNRNGVKGKLDEVIKGADAFLGVSAGGVLTKEMVKTMNKDPIIVALANPVPEIMPDEAREAGASVIATGRSDFPNQVNNSLVFPGIFRGAIDIRAPNISMKMKLASAHAIANLVTDEELNPNYIIPGSLDPRVPLAVSTSVVDVGTKDGLALREIDLQLYKENFKYFTLHGDFNPYKKITKD